jgi:uncharacterized protein (DUF433 family)
VSSSGGVLAPVHGELEQFSARHYDGRMQTRVEKWAYLAPNPKSAYKQLFVKGTRIRARVIYGLYAMEEDPLTPEQIGAEFGLPVEAVKEAIAYCKSNPPELLEDYAREEALVEASGMNDPNYKHHGKPKILTAEELARIYGPKSS